MKVTIWLMGGYGNQLFQYNYGEFLRSKGYDVSYNHYLLSRNITTRMLGWTIHEQMNTSIFPNDVSNVVKGLLVPLFAKIPLLNSLVCYYKHTARRPTARNIFGYFQDFFTEVETDHYISVPAVLPNQTIVCHLRLGDTVWNRGKETNILKKFLEFEPSRIN